MTIILGILVLEFFSLNCSILLHLFSLNLSSLSVLVFSRNSIIGNKSSKFEEDLICRRHLDHCRSYDEKEYLDTYSSIPDLVVNKKNKNVTRCQSTRA